MIDWLIWIVSWTLVLGGSLFVVAGGVGLVRLPDLYTRLHAASVTDTGGAVVLSLALLVQAAFVFGNPMAAIKVVLIMMFTLFTAPTASHALAKTALLCGRVPLGAGGRPLLDSPEEAMRLARSRPESPDARERHASDSSGADGNGGTRVDAGGGEGGADAGARRDSRDGSRGGSRGGSQGGSQGSSRGGPSNGSPDGSRATPRGGGRA